MTIMAIEIEALIPNQQIKPFLNEYIETKI